MEPLEALAILAAGIGAGAINAVVGSGTLLTFPVLIGARLRAADRQRLQQHRPRPGRCCRQPWLPPRAHRATPRAIARAGGLLGRRIGARRDAVAGPAELGLRRDRAGADRDRARSGRRPTAPRTGSLAHRRHPDGQHGIVVRGRDRRQRRLRRLLRRRTGDPADRASSGFAIDDSLQRLNGLKNVLAGLVNFTAGVIFVFAADVDWAVAGLIAAGSIVGAVFGGALRPPALADRPAGVDRRRRDRGDHPPDR